MKISNWYATEINSSVLNMDEIGLKRLLQRR